MTGTKPRSLPWREACIEAQHQAHKGSLAAPSVHPLPSPDRQEKSSESRFRAVLAGYTRGPGGCPSCNHHRHHSEET